MEQRENLSRDDFLVMLGGGKPLPPLRGSG
jgi:hypothetical protein